MASVGHISSIKDTRGSYKNTGVYPTDNFRMNLVVSDDKKQVVQKLKEQADIADFIFIMTDPDREGAQIA
jgi:DNA topoisomerase-1